jgi:hypothetical protein
MNNTRTLVEMGNFYEKTIIEEKKSVFPPKGTFELATAKKAGPGEAKKAPFVDTKGSGPCAEGNGFDEKKLLDPKKTKGKDFPETAKYSADTVNITKTLEKTESETINNFMSKSIFDKLYEEVMGGHEDENDAAALGISAEVETPEGEKGEEKNLKTLLADAIASLQKVHDALPADLGSEDKGDEEASDEEGSDEDAEEVITPSEDAEHKAKKEEEDEEANEATEMKEVPASAGEHLAKVGGTANQVGDETKKLVSKGGGDGKVTDKVGNDGDKGHALVGAGVKGGAPTSVKGKANVVASKTSKVGAYLAGLK